MLKSKFTQTTLIISTLLYPFCIELNLFLLSLLLFWEGKKLYYRCSSSTFLVQKRIVKIHVKYYLDCLELTLNLEKILKTVWKQNYQTVFK